MAIDYVRNVISSGYSLTKINENFENIELALQDSLSRSGNSPNHMTSDLDMNGNNILNINGINADSIIIDDQTVQEYLDESVADIIDEAQGYADDAASSAAAAATSEANVYGYADTASTLVAEAEDLVSQAVSGFVGFDDNQAYDFGFIINETTYFDQDWGSIA